MSYLYKHKHHGWQINYTLFFIDGTRKNKYKTFKSKTKAHLALQDTDRLEALSSQNKLQPNETIYFIHRKYITPQEARGLTNEKVCTLTEEITWENLADVYFKHVSSVGSRSTRESYPYKIRPILKYFKDKKPTEVSNSDIKGYVTHRRQTVSKATVNKEIIALRIMFDYPTECGNMKVNPAREVTIFSNLPEHLPRCLSPEELKTVIKSMRDYQACYGYFEELILTYLFTGMRRYELLSLKEADIDFIKKLIHIRGKGDKDRVIEMHPFLERIFLRTIDKNLAGNNRGKYLFGGKVGILMDENSVGRAFRIFLKRRGIYNNVSLHTLRHTFISYLIDIGVPIRKVQEIAGHSSLKTTLKYTHVIPSKTPTVSLLDYDKYFG